MTDGMDSTEPTSTGSTVATEEPEAAPEAPGLEEGSQADAESRASRLKAFRAKHSSLLPASWQVDLPVFEGPLDLLLHLIRINEVEITDIPVALICDQYHEYLGLMEELDLDIAGEYVYEAAVLIQLKSRLLLPVPELAEGEEPPEDPRQELVERLLDYQRIREAAETLAEVSSLRMGLWTRAPEVVPDDDDAGLEVGDVSLYDLLHVFHRVLSRYDLEHPDPLVVRSESFSVRAQIDRLLAKLDRSRATDLADDLLALSCRAEAISAFLAVLELVRMQVLRLQAIDGAVLLYRTERELASVELEAIVE